MPKYSLSDIEDLLAKDPFVKAESIEDIPYEDRQALEKYIQEEFGLIFKKSIDLAPEMTKKAFSFLYEK